MIDAGNFFARLFALNELFRSRVTMFQLGDELQAGLVLNESCLPTNMMLAH